MQREFFKNFGVGVGLRPDHYANFLDKPPSSVDWVEVITENYLDWPDRPAGRARQILEKVRRHLPVALHGVSLSIGSADPLSWDYLKRLKNLIDAIDPMIVSDHLCWTGVDGANLHDLLPLPYTRKVIEHITDKILTVQDFLGRRIILENVSSYLQFPVSEMSEAEFVSAISDRSDCGILLDINNVYVNAFNHNFDPVKYINSLPAPRIAQIHLAGHRKKGEILLDTHDEPVRDGVWDLYRYALKRVGPVSAMIERDGKIPEWTELERELLKLRRITEEFHEDARRRANSRSASAPL
jgi:uncharacterized protein (UPF0276 family)